MKRADLYIETQPLPPATKSEIKKQEVIFGFMMSVILMGALLIFYISWLVFMPVKILEIKHQPVRVQVEPIIAGKEMTFYLDYCKYEDAQAKVELTFEGEVILPVFAGLPHLPVGCHNGFPLKIIVPATTPDGVWHVFVKHIYRPNPLHMEEVSYITEDFKVNANMGIQQTIRDATESAIE